ncbi:MAG TPA: TetR/AcrR family transcriptional regulator [Melioribacteraceae bacterium]|nr:TetR/AcrR family transcriptional regulator [Melioribacteraceae bacterium]
MSETKEFILNTAFGLFLQKNYKEVTMKEIVDKTGLSKGAFYHYFTSKEELFREVIETVYFKNLVIDFKKINAESLKQFYTRYLDYMMDNFQKMREKLMLPESSVNINFITILFDAINLFPGFREELINALREELEAWTSIIKTARSKGEFTSPMTDEQIARMFIYSNDGISLRLLIEGKLDKINSEMLTLWNNFYEELNN